MKRILLITTALIVSTAITSNVSADHTRLLREDYDLNRIEVRNEYRSRLEENEFAYRRNRDHLLAERRLVARIDCHKTRARKMRAINHELSDLARAKAVNSREITAWFTSANRSLRHEYEVARRTVRRAPVVVETRVHAHPDNCVCDVCRPPIPVAPVVSECAVVTRGFDPGLGGYDTGYSDVGYDDYGRGPVREIHRDVSHRYERRSPNGLDIASIILSLLNN